MTAHDHHQRPDEPGRGFGRSLRDPVCGMTVDEDHAAARSKWQGRTYLFCTTACRDRFEREPARFASPRSEEG